MRAVCQVVQNVYDIDPRVRRKAEALVAAGYTVDVLALARADGVKEYQLNGVNVFTVALGKKRGSLLRYLFEYAAFFVWTLCRLTVLMRRRKYLAIDVNTLPDFLVFATIVARWMGAKIILDMHEITPEFYASKYNMDESSALVRLLTYIERASFRFADHVLTINEPIRDLLVRRGLAPSKLTVVMNAVDEERFTRCSPAGSGVLEPSPGTFVMMYHGTLTTLYGLDLAIEALAGVQDDIPGAELWILGSGPELSPLRALARERRVESRVRFIGQVPAAEILNWLNQCDAGILPIRRDIFLDFAFPNKLPEFIVAGKPVLVARLNAIRHYFNDEAVAFFEPNDPADLGQKMIRLCRDSDLRNRLAAAARRGYAPIRWDVMRARYLDLLSSVTGSHADQGAEADRVTSTVVAR